MFEFILGLLCWSCNEMNGGSSDSSFSSMSSGESWTSHSPSKKTSPSSSKGSSRKTDYFEESDSYFDRHGNEHILDDDGYCEDCDDYHEE